MHFAGGEGPQHSPVSGPHLQPPWGMVTNPNTEGSGWVPPYLAFFFILPSPMNAEETEVWKCWVADQTPGRLSIAQLRTVKAMVFPVQMWELDHKEDWVLKNWYFWIVVLEKTLESPLDCKEINSVNSKENQPWMFTGRTDAETPILWPPDAKSWLIRKEPDARKDWMQEEKWATEDEMIAWHHWLNGNESEQTLGDSEGQRSLTCCSSWGHKDSDVT